MLKQEIKIITILPNQYQNWLGKFTEFLNTFLQTCPESHKKNYLTTDWQSSSSSFLKCVYINQRYDKGIITVAMLDEKIVGLSACYSYAGKLYYMGSRSCVLPGHESLHLISSYLLPTQQDFLKQTADCGFISFNTDPFSVRLMESFKKT